jgi:hypothetical protein
MTRVTTSFYATQITRPLVDAPPLQDRPKRPQTTAHCGLHATDTEAGRPKSALHTRGASRNYKITRARNYSGSRNSTITQSPTRAHKGRNGGHHP